MSALNPIVHIGQFLAISISPDFQSTYNEPSSQISNYTVYTVNTISDTTALAMELISRPSVTPQDKGCQALIATRLERLGFTVESLDCGEVSNMYARYGSAEPHLTFIGHTDVVPTGDSQAWSYPPFSATLADSYLYGRGAADMKGSIAAMVTACERTLAPNRRGYSGSISFLLTSDEEGPAVDGIRYALEQLSARGEHLQYCLVGEPTSESELGDTIKIGRRGSLTGIITVHGQQGHVAYPHLADNPIHHSGALISALADCTWNDGDEQFPDTQLQISNVNSGVGAENVIPGELVLNFNIRFSPAQTVTDLKNKIESLCGNLGIDFDIEWHSPAQPYRNDRDLLALQVSLSVTDETGIRPRRSTSGGTSDGRFAAAHGAEVVELGPLNATIHQVDECVSVHDLDELSKIYGLILRRLAFVTANK